MSDRPQPRGEGGPEMASLGCGLSLPPLGERQGERLRYVLGFEYWYYFAALFVPMLAWSVVVVPLRISLGFSLRRSIKQALRP